MRRLKPYLRKAKPTGTVLGSGTYGSVIELISAKETVAGKVFRMSSTARLQAIADKVCGELIMMTQLHHSVQRNEFTGGPVTACASDGTADEQSPCLPPAPRQLQSSSHEQGGHFARHS